MSNRLPKGEMKPLNYSFQNRKVFSESVEPLSRNRNPNITQIELAYAICCRLEAAGDVFSSEIIRNIVCFDVLNFEVARFSIFQDIQLKFIS